MNHNSLCLDPGAKTILCIGAHPDDCEISCSGAAAIWVRAGNRVVFLSLTDGRGGHHILDPETVAAKRKLEASAAARVIGAESRVLDIRDGHLEPTLDNRARVIRIVREIMPDIIITNRSNDYHPDHRYTALLVQDSAYMFMVPHVVPDTPPLQYNPVIFFWSDAFTYPRPFCPQMVVDIDEVFETKLDMLIAHESQVFEWLPWIGRSEAKVPGSDAPQKRREWLRDFYRDHYDPPVAERFRDLLVSRYGETRGSAVREAEAFELCEYGTRPGAADIERIFEEL